MFCNFLHGSLFKLIKKNTTENPKQPLNRHFVKLFTKRGRHMGMNFIILVLELEVSTTLVSNSSQNGEVIFTANN